MYTKLDEKFSCILKLPIKNMDKTISDSVQVLVEQSGSSTTSSGSGVEASSKPLLLVSKKVQDNESASADKIGSSDDFGFPEESYAGTKLDNFFFSLILDLKFFAYVRTYLYIFILK